MSDLGSIRKMLEGALNRKRDEAFKKDREELIRTTGKDLLAQLSPEEKKNLLDSVGKDMVSQLTPLLSKIAEGAKVSKDEIVSAIQGLKIDGPQFDNEGMKEGLVSAITEAFSGLRIPKPDVKVNVPEVKVKIPDIKMPEEMDIKGWVGFLGYDKSFLTNPLPVQIRDASGKPVSLGGDTIISGGGGRGIARIGGVDASAFASYQNGDGRFRVSVETGGSGLTDTELRAAHLDVQQVSGSADSVNVMQIGGNAVVVGSGYQDNALRVVQATDAIASVNVVNTNTIDVQQVSGSALSTYVRPQAIGDSKTDDVLRVYHVADAIVSVKVTGFDTSLAASLIDSSGVQYSGSNPVPVSGSVSVSGSIASTVVTGPVVSDAVDDNSAPVQVGGIARTANPTAVAAGDVVKATFDDLGRMITRPVQVRDLIQTAYVSLTNGTETTLLAGAASTFHDLIYIMMANNSDAAVMVDVRAGTANGVVLSVEVPASGTAGVAPKVPIPQDVAANAWTVDMSDITGTTVNVSALFSKEV